jgi:hypothetical protein
MLAKNQPSMHHTQNYHKNMASNGTKNKQINIYKKLHALNNRCNFFPKKSWSVPTEGKDNHAKSIH